MANVDTNEEFWGITLSKEKKTHTWNPAATEEDVEHKIQVTQACLGLKAKEGERNVVEVTTEDDEGNKMSCSIVSLRVGFVECMHLELGFTNPVKFMLREGNGPISLCGVHLSALPLDLDEEDEDEDTSEDEEVPRLVQPKKPAKAKVKENPVEKVEVVENKEVVAEEAAPVAPPVEEKKADAAAEEKNGKKRVLPEEEKEEVAAKKKKPEVAVAEAKAATAEAKAAEEEEEDEDDDEDDVEDVDMDDLDDDDDDEDDDDDDEDDDEDDDDEMESDEDEEEEEEDEEEEETPKPKKKPAPKINGHPPKKDTKPTTPAAKQIPKAVTPKTKDTPAKKDTTTPKKTPDELRTFLLKSPNLPKKYEKFSNFLKNNMKVTDSSTQKELWEFVQKNKK